MTFSMIKQSVVAIAIVAATAFGTGATAATDYEGVYDATSVNTNGNLHTLWLPDLFSSPSVNAYWQFVPNPGKFKVAAGNATAHLTGTIVNNVMNNLSMMVDIAYTLRNPNQPGTGGFKGGSGDVSDAANWSFFTMTLATLTGTGDLGGLQLSLTEIASVPFQLGDGANDKNPGLGASGWFTWVVDSQASNTTYSAQASPGHGDVNLNLKLAPIPLPATGILLVGAIGALGAAAARKKRKAANS
jgi:hypothetical protein